mgnify:CR=1 FL=1
MDDNRKLSHVLSDLDFFSALGTSEYCGLEKNEGYVKRGGPFTYDFNMGVLVVYDEKGHPWIKQNFGERTKRELSKLRDSFPLARGAYVPHSNDSGRFIHQVLPIL